MTLRTNGLNWLATNAGSGNCFATSGINYRHSDGVSDTGGTKDVVTAFVVAHMVGNDSAQIIAGTSYTAFKAINDGQDLSMSDVTEANDRQADGGTYPQYCVAGATPTPTPTPSPTCTPGTKRCRNNTTIEQCNTAGTGWYDVQTCGTGYTCQNGSCVPSGTSTPTPTTKPVTPPFEVTIKEGTQCSQGSPSVTLDTSEAFAYFKTDPLMYVGIMDILVNNVNTSGNNCWAYFIWEMRMWDGPAGTTCPTGVPEVQEICRFLGEVSATKALSIKMLSPSETDMIGGSFEIPSYVRGTKTICLSLWGNYSKQALIDEIEAAGYPKEIPW